MVFHAAAGAGLGAFEAAADLSGGSRGHLWAIGVDTDQYERRNISRAVSGREDASSARTS